MERLELSNQLLTDYRENVTGMQQGKEACIADGDRDMRERGWRWGGRGSSMTTAGIREVMHETRNYESRYRQAEKVKRGEVINGERKK